MKNSKFTFILSIIAILYFLFMGTGKAISAEKTIRIGSPFPSGHILTDAAEKFKELIEKRSGGRIAVQFEFGTKSEEEIIRLNSAGEVEMQSNGTQFLQIFAPPYYFFTGPYVMKDFDHYMRVWNGKLGQQAQAEMAKNGNMKYLGTIYRGVRQTTTKKPLYMPADVSGLKLRLPVIPSWIAVWK
ncbi:MAG: TRAP transporter substrate-binding protein DctP, partial [Deltaproteobacteria bacterium]